MKGFIIALISVATLNGALGMISPEGDIKKYVRLVGSLCLLCALVAPVYGAFTNGDIDFDGLIFNEGADEESYEQIYGEALAQGAREALEASVKQKVTEKLGLSDKDIDVTVLLGYDGEKYYAESAEAVLHGSAVFADPREISALINQLCGCSCTVIYD